MAHRLPLVFVHGNGIPRPVYQKMMIGLSHRFIPTGVDRVGHDPAYPVTDAWPRLLDQLREHIAAVGQPVTLLGHGSGGWLCLMAAYRAPERIRAVILLDAPLPGVRQAQALHWLKQAGLAGLPGWLLRRWRTESGIDPECHALLRRFGSLPGDRAPDEPSRADHRRFDEAVGRRIHQTVPTDLATLVRGGPPTTASGRPVPVGLLIGRQSMAAKLCGLGASNRLVGANRVVIEGSHLFPLERPLVTAKEIVRLHDRMIGAVQDPARTGARLDASPVGAAGSALV